MPVSKSQGQWGSDKAETTETNDLWQKKQREAQQHPLGALHLCPQLDTDPFLG